MKTENTTEKLGTATYSPEDNKLRFTPFARLSKDDYNRARSAGFIWAPKQELFVSPMWTPDREDLMLEWCGKIDDEDTSLVERAEMRAERFEDYSEKRQNDAERAREAVESIAGNIPLGQPILVGHHSERHARRDAEKIENGMRRAVKMWETSKYWEDRAKGALRHAKYKERPDVRARRIKGLEASKRKQERNRAESEQGLRFWRGEMKMVRPQTGEKFTLEITEANRKQIRAILGGVLGNTVGHFNVAPKEGGASWEGWSAWNVLEEDETRYKACPSCTVEQCRVAAESSFTGRIAHYNRWIAHYENRLAYERAMLAAEGGTVADKTGPEKGGAVRCWVARHWLEIIKVNKVSVSVEDSWGPDQPKFLRTVPFDKLSQVISKAEWEAMKNGGESSGRPARWQEVAHAEAVAAKHQEEKQEAAPFDAMKNSLREGVKVVSAPQLFPTPPDLAKQMVERAFENGWGVQICAEMNERCRILEPSAGTGNIVRAIQAANQTDRALSCEVHAVEINHSLAAALEDLLLGEDIHCADFLQCNGDLGKFDRILMNPPFADGQDIAHIKHAIGFLNPGGRLVAICANGPRQNEQLKPMADEWLDLPAGSFKESGTMVNAAMLVINR